MKKMTKILALLLAAVMLLALAACGKSGGKAAATPTPDTAYVSEFYSFPGTYSGSEARFEVLTTDENGFVGMVNELVGQREPYEGETAEYEGQFDVYEPRLYHMDFTGKMTALSYVPRAAENAPKDADISRWINGLVRTDSGFLALEELYVGWNDAPASVERFSDEWYEYYQSEDHYYLRRLDAQGRELSCAEMNLEPLSRGDEYFNPYRIAVLEDGTVLASGDNSVCAFDADSGEYLYRIKTGFDWIMDMLQAGDGEIYVIGYAQSGNDYRPMLAPVNAKKQSIGKALPVEGDLYNAIPGSGRFLLYYTNGSSFYGYDKDKNEEVKLFNWINVDVSEAPESIAVLPDGSIVGLLTEWDRNYETATRTLMTIREVPYASLPEKTVLTLATDGLDWYLRRELVRFNRASDTVRIELLDYSEYDDYENDYDENGYGESGGMTKLRTEILAGNMPDILDLNGMPTRQLAAKGLLMDLYPMLDADPELSRGDIFPNVLKALETNGKLTSVSSGFYIQTCIGAASVVGSTPGWTYEQLNAALATMPEGCSVFGVTTTRDSVLKTMLELDMGQFVDWDTGRVNFNSEEFIAMLNFVKEFPATFNWDNYEWSEEDEDYNRLRRGQQLLLNYGLSGMEELSAYESIFGSTDNFTFIGYPTSEGVGNMLVVNSGYAISRDCKDPEAAWQFLRVLLTEKYQEDYGYNFPTNANLFEKKKKDAMTPTYQRDENGRILLDPETGEKLMEPKSYGVDLTTWEEIPIYVYTEQQIARIDQVIAATDRVPDSNKALLDIVREEAQGFFAGQRTAEEVAKLVQSKANIYVNEQK